LRVVRIRGSTLSFLTKIVYVGLSLFTEIVRLYLVKDQLFPFWLRLFVCTLSRISSFFFDWDLFSISCQGSTFSLFNEITRYSSAPLQKNSLIFHP